MIRVIFSVISMQTLALMTLKALATWESGTTSQKRVTLKANVMKFLAHRATFSTLSSQRIKLWSCFHLKCAEASQWISKKIKPFTVWRHLSSVEVIERSIMARCTLRMNATVVASAFLRVCLTCLRADTERQSSCRSHISTMLTLFTMNKLMEWSQTRTSTNFSCHSNR